MKDVELTYEEFVAMAVRALKDYPEIGPMSVEGARDYIICKELIKSMNDILEDLRNM